MGNQLFSTQLPCPLTQSPPLLAITMYDQTNIIPFKLGVNGYKTTLSRYPKLHSSDTYIDQIRTKKPTWCVITFLYRSIDQESIVWRELRCCDTASANTFVIKPEPLLFYC